MDNGIHYGFEFLGPKELRTRHQHPFVHTISGVLAIADAAGGKTGFLFVPITGSAAAGGRMIFILRHRIAIEW